MAIEQSTSREIVVKSRARNSCRFLVLFSLLLSLVPRSWIPYTGSPNKCELNCMPRGERFFYRHRNSVVDGTPCKPDTNDVCVKGKCMVSCCYDRRGVNYYCRLARVRRARAIVASTRALVSRRRSS